MCGAEAKASGLPRFTPHLWAGSVDYPDACGGRSTAPPVRGEVLGAALITRTVRFVVNDV
jgi:hypothetical protein